MSNGKKIFETASYCRVSTMMMLPDPLQLGVVRWRTNRADIGRKALVFMDELFKKSVIWK